MMPEHLWAWLSAPLVALLVWMLGLRVSKSGRVTDVMQERLLGESERLDEKLEKAVAMLEEFQQTVAELKAEVIVLRAKAQLLHEQIERAGLTPVVAINDPA